MATRSTRTTLFTVGACIALVVGAVMAIQVGLTAVRVTRMSGWPTVPATLEQVELHRPGSATSRSLSVGARYHYAVGGQIFTSGRVSIYPPDSVGAFFQRTYDDLHARLERKESVPAHVNPTDPSEAVLLPVWRPELMALQLAIVGLAWGAGAWAFSRRHLAVVPDPDESDRRTGDARDSQPGAAAPVVAWGRRLVLTGMLIAAGDYALLERSRGEQFTWLDRALASRVSGSGSVFVSPPDERLPALLDEVSRSLGSSVQVSAETQDAQAARFRLRIEAADRTAALDALNQFRERTQARYRTDTGRELTTFADAYVVPVVSPSARRTAQAIVWGAGLLGVACIGLGLTLVRRDAVNPADD